MIRFPNVSHRLAATNAPLPRGLRGWLRGHVEEFDAVLLFDVYSAPSVLAARAARRARVPYVLQALGTLPATPERGRAGVKACSLRCGAGARFARRLRASTSRKSSGRSTWPRVPTRRDSTICPRRSSFPAGDGRAAVPTVLYLGQLHRIKRIDVLIQAFARVREELPDARLEVVGAPSSHGEELRRSRAAAGDSVEFRGLITEEEKAGACGGHVFALLSASEGLPVTPLEALACGTPVVLSPGCGLPQVDGVAGIVCDGTAEGAAEALLQLLRDPARARQLGEAGREFAASYRREVVVPRLLELLERVATSSSSSA